jgi:hypothetical protein
VLGPLADLESFPVPSHDEALALVELNGLWGKRLRSAAPGLGIDVIREPGRPSGR